METSEATPEGAVRAPDLADVVARAGPFATVYLTTESRIENAAHRSEQRWKAARRDLEAQGAPRAAVETVDPWVAEGHLHGECLAVVSTAEGLLHVEHGPDPLPVDVATWAPLPSLGRVLAWRQEALPYVTVLVDRRGADIAAFRRERRLLEVEAEGEDYPIRKAAPGGWSQRRYQQRAENTWEHNAKNVAEEVARVVERVGARLVVAAGDVRAIQLLREDLPDSVLAILHVVKGGRSWDGSEDEFAVEVRGALDALVRRDRERLLDLFEQELGQGDRAARGAAPTLEALSMSQVDVLIVSDDPDDRRTAWFGPGPSQISAEAAVLRSLGAEPVVEARLVDVAVRGALRTGAGILVLPGGEGPDEGLGAILRWGTRP